jgi:hypothetical protein
MKIAIVTGVTAATIMLAGCSKNGSSSGSTTSSAAQADAILQPALTAWQQGDKATAVSNFLAADWSSRPSSVSGSTLSLTKDQYRALSDADRQAKSIQVTAQLNALRDLTEYGVEQAGLDAASKGDTAQARKYFMSLKQCGTALDSPDVMQIVQLTGKAIKKIADKEMAKIGQ